MPRFLHYLFPSAALILMTACSGVDAREEGSPAAQGVRLEQVVTGLDAPWGMDFLPDGDLLVTEKPGRLQRIDPKDGSLVAIAGVPESSEAGQGGMLDVMVGAVDGEEPWVYLSYAIAGKGGYSTRIARARLGGDRLSSMEILFTAEPFYPTRRHFGSRLQLVDDYLYASIGDRANRDGAQDLSTHNGTVIRLHADGRVPADNPFVGHATARPEIWTYGHRNPQGMARHPVDGTIWISEHGPQGGDEINRLVAGANYGWPVITYGEEYGGGKIGEGTHKAGMEQPLKYYVPSIGASGIEFYRGDLYPGWKDSLLVSSLVRTHLNRVELDGAGLGAEQRLFEDSEMRFRDVQQAPDGTVYVLAGGDGLFRLVPTAGD